jgi:hypothetical protein
VAAGVGTLVWVSVALALDDIAAVGSVVGVADAANAVGSARVAMGVGLGAQPFSTIKATARKAMRNVVEVFIADIRIDVVCYWEQGLAGSCALGSVVGCA